jgi:hypothetical protein
MFNELSQMEITAERKFQSIAGLMNSTQRMQSVLQGEEDYLKNELSRIKDKIKASENLQERLKFLMLVIVNAIGSQKFRGKSYSTKKTKSLVITDEELAVNSVPEEFLRIKKEIKKTELKQAIESRGVSYSGVSVVENEHLSIR